ncbi:hypothetical protein D3C80_1429670 [compost metagenome]
MKAVDDSLGGHRRRLDHARGHADQVGAQADGLGRVDAVANPARADQQGVRQGVARLGQGAGGGDAPVGKGQGMSLVRRLGRPLAFDQAPVGAAGPGHVDAGRAHGD